MARRIKRTLLFVSPLDSYCTRIAAGCLYRSAYQKCKGVCAHLFNTLKGAFVPSPFSQVRTRPTSLKSAMEQMQDYIQQQQCRYVARPEDSQNNNPLSKQPQQQQQPSSSSIADHYQQPSQLSQQPSQQLRNPPLYSSGGSLFVRPPQQYSLTSYSRQTASSTSSASSLGMLRYASSGTQSGAAIPVPSDSAAHAVPPLRAPAVTMIDELMSSRTHFSQIGTGQASAETSFREKRGLENPTEPLGSNKKRIIVPYGHGLLAQKIVGLPTR